MAEKWSRRLLLIGLPLREEALAEAAGFPRSFSRRARFVSELPSAGWLLEEGLLLLLLLCQRSTTRERQTKPTRM